MSQSNRKKSQAIKGLNNKQPTQKQEDWNVEKILDARKIDDRMEFLIRWENFSSEYDSWIQESQLIGEWAKNAAEEFLIDKMPQMMNIKVYQQKCTARYKRLMNGIIVSSGDTRFERQQDAQNSTSPVARLSRPIIKSQPQPIAN
ncbi:hypothetical protein OXYTRIMIC_084 [Oxytricha trifallax]|uniref:Chromo domain-containing protein n=1 Tax=Oxytricha trifallax TaxID=1172189 RepID=A0A073HY12_9SPIT|nr:hypothetical protein OXYTRIMIC_084 [Oxytricha trifallax]